MKLKQAIKVIKMDNEGIYTVKRYWRKIIDESIF